MDTQSRIFDPKSYLDRWYKAPSQGEDNKFYIWMNKAMDLIDSECKWGIEIGCGPILVLAAFASKKVPNLIMTEYNTECFKWIEAWQNDQKQSPYYYDWSKYFDIIAKIQKKDSGDQVAQQVRASLKICLKVDLMAYDIFQYPILVKPDIITSSLCLQAAAESYEDYQEMIKKLKATLKPKGYLFLLGVLEESFYMSGYQRLPCLPIKKQFVHDTLTNCGFNILFYEQEKVDSQDPEKTGYDGKAFFGLLAQKKQ